MCFLDELESLRIPFGDIKEATKNFTTIIGKGGYGLVYKGELLLNGKLTSVAIKRLDGNNISGQGFKEFLTEIQLLTRYKHPNLIALIGFCDQDNEKILIYEHAEHGSLDKYLTTAENRSKLTWKQRINICVNAARGLNFLHSEVARNERVIHRDIKCANILLDRNWKAMVSDLGLSKLGRANEKDTYLITNASGTHGYCDPVYISSGILTKESDVYSFGVVLFEVLCGRLCFINVNNEHRFLPPLAQRYCKLGKIDEIMDPVLKNQIDSDSLNKFSKIAFQCLQNNRKRRPSMSMVVKKLEVALNLFNMNLKEHWNSNHTKTRTSYQEVNLQTSLQNPESLYKADNVEPDQHKSEHMLISEIAKFTDNGCLEDFVLLADYVFSPYCNVIPQFSVCNKLEVSLCNKLEV
uniref:receptor-like protein kinase HERK 1 isoform X2 n=1 Tax=Erigeron canadensis TaxID=72917 RepID=UPI001CB8ACB6|nr:receptor-like protein kinase HERK 1 isoform X2 [Erigeron canadensis]